MRVGFVGSLFLVGMLLGACTSATASQPEAPRDALAITCDDLAGQARGQVVALERSVAVTVGEAFRITLCSNPSTGFAWDQPAVAGPAGIVVVDHAATAPSGALVGAAGSEAFTFRAGAAGAATIDLTYSQPWAGGEKGAWLVRVTVTAS